jgi:hypothetical protein
VRMGQPYKSTMDWHHLPSCWYFHQAPK